MKGMFSFVILSKCAIVLLYFSILFVKQCIAFIDSCDVVHVILGYKWEQKMTLYAKINIMKLFQAIATYTPEEQKQLSISSSSSP